MIHTKEDTGWSDQQRLARPMSAEFKKPYYRKLYETVKHEYETKEIFPDANDIFNAFEFTPLSR